jgi:transcriptional regulator with XRE-family HTH domain
MTDNIPIHRRLKEARLAKGLSQKNLGIAAGIDEFVASARMNQYEVGKHTPDFMVLENIAKVLGVPTAYFYTHDDTLAELIRVYGSLTVQSREKLLKAAYRHLNASA